VAEIQCGKKEKDENFDHHEKSSSTELNITRSVMKKPSSAANINHFFSECSTLACITSKYGFNFIGEFGACSCLSRFVFIL